ncbi:MAG TPA: hypothetical protein DEF43_17060 [Chloroflexus aurantiacus]|jgi:transposase|nr:MAG: transposase [Chloroflexota bacterium]HBW68821.1 hypothetical protein [Chloroflexus aurantiacus]
MHQRPTDTLNDTLSVMHTGCAWADLPKEYGAPSTCWRRLHEWSQDETWERSWRTRLSHRDADGKLAWAQALLDGSVVPANKGAMAEAKRRLATARR